MNVFGMMGERLGTIGQDPEQLPSWKQDFLSKPSASVRKGIAWGTQPAYEDTSTLVLTAPSSKFIDVRYPISSQNASATQSHPSFWAFSGVASTSFYDESSTQPYSIALTYTARCKFLHDIDTRGPGIVDQGDMCLLPNGDCLEFGHMVNPQTGQDEPYKEYWTSAEPVPHPDGIDDSRTCTVAEVVSPSNVKGITIKIGGRIQGILSRGHNDGSKSIEVERLTRDSAGAWARDPRSTKSFVPCSWLAEQGRSQGDKVDFDGLLWNVTEAQH